MFFLLTQFGKSLPWHFFFFLHVKGKSRVQVELMELSSLEPVTPVLIHARTRLDFSCSCSALSVGRPTPLHRRGSAPSVSCSVPGLSNKASGRPWKSWMMGVYSFVSGALRDSNLSSCFLLAHFMAATSSSSVLPRGVSLLSSSGLVTCEFSSPGYLGTAAPMS